MGYELRRVVTESRLGRPLEEALEGVAERMDSEDFAWAVGFNYACYTRLYGEGL